MKLLALVFVAAICRAQNAAGLLATLNDGSHSLQLAVPTPNFYLDAGESLHPQLGPAVEAGFTGNLAIAQAGEYRFDAGAATLEIDGRAGVTFELAAGEHPIRLHFLRRPGVAAVQLRWMSSRIAWESVPASAFSHRAVDTPAEMGRTLVEHAGCANCHAAPLLAQAAPSLAGAGSRFKPAWLYRWLGEPHSNMPALLAATQQADVVAFLSTLKTTLRAVEGDAVKGGGLSGTFECAACHALTGLGSKYSSRAALADRVRNRHEPPMLLDESAANALAAHFLRPENSSKGAPAGDAARGREAAEALGCIACHATPGLTNRLNARPLHEVYTAACKGARYDFSIDARDAIKAFLRTYRAHPDRSPAPVYAIRRLLAEERCAACHRQTPARAIPPVRRPHYPADAVASLAKAGGAAPR